MPGALLGLVLYALLSIGTTIAVVLTIKALRRIARNHERSVALLEELVQQQRSDPPDSGPHGADTSGPSAP
ncbi:MAG: hypothetical protein ABEK84_03510 [Salinibacter sp.]